MCVHCLLFRQKRLVREAWLVREARNTVPVQRLSRGSPPTWGCFLWRWHRFTRCLSLAPAQVVCTTASLFIACDRCVRSAGLQAGVVSCDACRRRGKQQLAHLLVTPRPYLQFHVWSISYTQNTYNYVRRSSLVCRDTCCGFAIIKQNEIMTIDTSQDFSTIKADRILFATTTHARQYYCRFCTSKDMRRSISTLLLVKSSQ